MNKRQVKHIATPRPKPKFFRLKHLQNVENKSEGTHSNNPVHLDKKEDNKEAMNDPYRFPSDTSWCSDRTDKSTESSWTSLGSDIDSDDDIQFGDSVFSTNATKGSDILEFSSPEELRFRDRDNIQFRDCVFNSTEIEEYDFRNPKLASTRNEGSGNDAIFKSVIPATKTRKTKPGTPKLTSTRNEGHYKDIVFCGSTINTTKKNNSENSKLTSTRTEELDFGNPKLASTRNEGSGNNAISATKSRGSLKEEENFIDSHYVDTENSSPHLSVGIDDIDSFVKTPPFEDFDYNVDDEVMEVHEESPIPISLKTFVKEEDKGHISKFSKENESPERRWPSFKRYSLESENCEDLHITIEVDDIEDDVFEIPNDKSSVNTDVVLLQETSSEEPQEWNEYLESLRKSPLSKTFSDIKRRKNKRRKHVRRKNASVVENQDSNTKQKKRKSYHSRKRHTTLKSVSVTEEQDSNLNQKRRKHSHRRKKNKTVFNIAEYQVEQQTSEIPLSRSPAPFADSRRPVNSTAEKMKSKPKTRRRRKQTQKNKEKRDEYQKYLQKLPICDLIKKETFSDIQSIENEKKRKSKVNKKRYRNQTKKSNKKLNEYKKYLASLPICDLSIKKTFSDIQSVKSESGISCFSIKKEL